MDRWPIEGDEVRTKVKAEYAWGPESGGTKGYLGFQGVPQHLGEPAP